MPSCLRALNQSSLMSLFQIKTIGLERLSPKGDCCGSSLPNGTRWAILLHRSVIMQFMDKTPKYNTLRPYSITVSNVAEMSTESLVGETAASFNVKMPTEQAQKLYELLGKRLENKPHGFISFNISGLLK